MSSDPASVQLHETRYGDSGPWVVFCHGLFGQGRNWTTLAKELSSDYHVVLLDMPNHGRSGSTQTFSYAEHAAIVAAHLAGITEEPWRVVGHSMGGKIAMLIALNHPKQVDRLCVVDVSPVRYDGVGRDIERFAAAMHALDLGALGDRADADQALRAEVRSDAVRGFLLQNLRREHGQWRWQMNLDLLAAQLDRLSDFPQVQATYDGPVLWVAGADSDYVRPEYDAAMRELFPATRLVTVKNAGHWVHSEQPDVFSEIIRRFLQAPAE